MKKLSRRMHLVGMVYYEDPLLSKSAWGKCRTQVNNKKNIFIWAASRLLEKKGSTGISWLIKKVRNISNFLSKIRFQINRDPVLVCNKRKPVASGRILEMFGSRQMFTINISGKLAESIQNSVVFTVCFLVLFNEVSQNFAILHSQNENRIEYCASLHDPKNRHLHTAEIRPWNQSVEGVNANMV